MGEFPVKTYAVKVLAAIGADIAALEAEMARLESEGYRIVDGGQTGDYDDRSFCTWEITDCRTGAILASGSDGYKGYKAASDKGNYYHVDHIDHVTGTGQLECEEGFAGKLTNALLEWMEDPNTSDEAIAELVGQPVEVVYRTRRSGAYERPPATDFADRFVELFTNKAQP